MNNFCSFGVHDPNPLSDHCIIEFSLEFKCNVSSDGLLNLDDDVPSEKVENKYQWNKNKCND